MINLPTLRETVCVFTAHSIFLIQPKLSFFDYDVN